MRKHSHLEKTAWNENLTMLIKILPIQCSTAAAKNRMLALDYLIFSVVLWPRNFDCICHWISLFTVSTKMPAEGYFFTPVTWCKQMSHLVSTNIHHFIRITVTVKVTIAVAIHHSSTNFHSQLSPMVNHHSLFTLSPISEPTTNKV